MKKFFNNLLKTILVVGLIGLIVWVVLYFTVPKVKEWTNEKFHISANKDDKEDEEKKALQDENADLKARIEDLESNVTTVSSKYDSVSEKLKETEEKLATANSEKEMLEEALAEDESAIAHLQEKGKATEEELAAAKSQLASTKTALENKTAEVETLTQEKNALASEKQSLETELAQKQAEINSLQQKVAALEEAQATDPEKIYLSDISSETVYFCDYDDNYKIVSDGKQRSTIYKMNKFDYSCTKLFQYNGGYVINVLKLLKNKAIFCASGSISNSGCIYLQTGQLLNTESSLCTLIDEGAVFVNGSTMKMFDGEELYSVENVDGVEVTFNLLLGKTSDGQYDFCSYNYNRGLYRFNPTEKKFNKIIDLPQCSDNAFVYVQSLDHCFFICGYSSNLTIRWISMTEGSYVSPTFPSGELNYIFPSSFDICELYNNNYIHFGKSSSTKQYYYDIQNNTILTELPSEA